MLTTARGKPRLRLPPLNPIRMDAMLRQISTPPEIIVVESDGLSVAQANPSAVVIDREAKAIRQNRAYRSLKAPRVFRLVEQILTALPRTDLSRDALIAATGIDGPNDLSICLRQARHNLLPFGVGITSAYGGRVFITEVEAAPSC